MFAIYKNCANHPFVGVVVETEEKAWEYLDKKYGKEIHLSNGTSALCGCSRINWIIEKIEFYK